MRELLGIAFAGMAAFLLMFIYIIAGLAMLALGAFAGLCLILALFSLAVWLATGASSAITAMLGFLAWGGASFTVIVVAIHCHERLLTPRLRSPPRGAIRERYTGSADSQGVDAPFNP